jgi:DNA mismatch repair protein MutL
LLVEKDETLLIIDQHAAHERIIFDKLVNQFKKNSITPQVIVPYVFTTKVSTAILLEELRLTLLNLGYTFEQINSQSYALTSIPPFISYDTAIKTFLELIEDKEILKKQTDLAYKTFANLACKEAVKKNEQLTTEEVEHLLFHTFNEDKLYCPHGRNFIIEISLQDLEKRFGRKD